MPGEICNKLKRASRNLDSRDGHRERLEHAFLMSNRNVASVLQVGPATDHKSPGREAVTLFKRLAVWPDGAASLVECR